MASEKKPSIYSDRSTIGSSDELDEYGVWVKSEPQDLSAASGETKDFSAVTLPDLDTGFDDNLFDSAADDLELPDFELPDVPMDTDTEVEDDGLFDEIGSETTESLDDTGVEEIGFDDFSIPDDSAVLEDTLPEESDSDAVYESEGFTEVPVEDFLEETPAELPEAAAAGVSTRPDLSTELLMKIAEELSSIKSELSNLKKEFSAVKAAPSSADAEAHGGFFSEEEDEKIALTGDELDNILNTADFTEEAGEDATEELEGEFSFPEETEGKLPSEPFQLDDELSIDLLSPEDLEELPETLSDQDDIITGDDDAAGIDADLLDIDESDIDEAESAGEEIPDSGFENPEEAEIFEHNYDNIEIESPDDFEDSIEDSSEDSSLDIDLDLEDDGGETETPDGDDAGIFDAARDSEELEQLRVEGAQPMTPAPEDTSYLDEELLTEELETIEESEIEESENEFPALEEMEENVLEDLGDFEITLDDIIETPDEQEYLSIETAEEPLEEISLDLSDAVIDEPDLSAEITENPPLEPAPGALEELSDDLSIDMESLGFAEDEFEEDSFEQIIPEGFDPDDDSAVSLEDELEAEETAELAVLDIPAADPATDNAPDIDAEDVPAKADIPGDEGIPSGIKDELKTVLSYMDQLLESLPEEKIEEFARSEYFDTYKKLFRELGLV